jgi:hypothetical protein
VYGSSYSTILHTKLLLCVLPKHAASHGVCSKTTWLCCSCIPCRKQGAPAVWRVLPHVSHRTSVPWSTSCCCATCQRPLPKACKNRRVASSTEHKRTCSVARAAECLLEALLCACQHVAAGAHGAADQHRLACSRH